ncbi:MAG: hypothetical protein J7K57_06115 [Palaeococcus sp.]|uniref:hypothetical protein n=1 Tax=Palaeococcus sp. (in: euryarchaeotes) TaxID=2820298 RepID=UPI0025F4856C|nr:hypothetical protein [Palaeococcus sp. (in: euryarchaeotes)]MCD6559431.1 hypothetical protein [Palaeococcus sp. (in: euryarchaeotes)]
MNILEIFYKEALEVFHKAGGSKEEFYWLISGMLVRYSAYKEELEIRRKLMDLIVQEVEGKILDAGCGLGILTFRMALKDEVKKSCGHR